MSEEAINHPPHYGGDTPYEAIKVIKAWGLGFSLGNAVKYIARAGKKGGEAQRLEDLRKALWYLEDEIGNGHPDPTPPYEICRWVRDTSTGVQRCVFANGHPTEGIGHRTLLTEIFIETGASVRLDRS